VKREFDSPLLLLREAKMNKKEKKALKKKIMGARGVQKDAGCLHNA
tara:strand:+ start:112 stop:249 length:138 start_codon:yes stop_codon:yes gene_type:complete